MEIFLSSISKYLLPRGQQVFLNFTANWPVYNKIPFLRQIRDICIEISNADILLTKMLAKVLF